MRHSQKNMTIKYIWKGKKEKLYTVIEKHFTSLKDEEQK